MLVKGGPGILLGCASSRSPYNCVTWSRNCSRWHRVCSFSHLAFHSHVPLENNLSVIMIPISRAQSMSPVQLSWLNTNPILHLISFNNNDMATQRARVSTGIVLTNFSRTGYQHIKSDLFPYWVPDILHKRSQLRFCMCNNKTIH